ncbi:centrosomal protein kizuna-like isoform X3 [Artibeus jamaicensis]|uniref:centrosomal protein kizuna-like isoform X3 n=1 Tax=Artibeus jamaicensis TaxID=9417 RepID=UPI00235A5321|nr:centrosomal protein kizuna-like isoform X3 [Artibeus jamaicensis]
MRPASALSSPVASPDYYERLGSLQQGLRDSEKKRLDLEKKLYEYSQSDICRVKLKYVRLKKYLKEICESEKKAHTRNKEYLKQLECIQACVGHFTTNTEKLQELKIEYEAQIEMQLPSKDSLGVKGEPKNEDREKERLSPENRTTDLKCDSSSRSEGSEGEILSREYTEVKEERARPPVSLISVLEHCASGNKCSQEKHSAGDGFSGWVTVVMGPQNHRSPSEKCRKSRKREV